MPLPSPGMVHCFAFFCRAVAQPGIPRQRHSNAPAVRQEHPEEIFACFNVYRFRMAPIANPLQDARRLGFQCRDIQMPGRMVNVKSDDAARCVKIRIDPINDLHGVGARPRMEFYVEAVSIWVITESDWASFLKRLSMKALCIASPSDKATTRRTRFFGFARYRYYFVLPGCGP